MIIIRSSFIITFTEIIKVKLVHPRFPPPLVLPHLDHQCPEDQPFSLVSQDRTGSNSPSSVLTNNLHTGLVLWKDPQDCPRAGRHCELQKAEVKKCEESVQRVLGAVRNFTDPFTVTYKNRLYSLASGAPSPWNSSWTCSEQKLWADFIGQIQSGEPGSFFDPIKKTGFKTMETCNKKITLTSSQGKVIMCSNTRDLFCFNCCIFNACHCFYIVEWSSCFSCVDQIIIVNVVTLCWGIRGQGCAIYKIILNSRRRRQTWVINGGWDLRKFTVGMQFQTNIS